MKSSESLKITCYAFIPCLLFAVGSEHSVNGVWTPEYVPEDAELVVATSLNCQSLKYQLLCDEGKTQDDKLLIAVHVCINYDF